MGDDSLRQIKRKRRDKTLSASAHKREQDGMAMVPVVDALSIAAANRIGN